MVHMILMKISAGETSKMAHYNGNNNLTPFFKANPLI